MTPCRRCNEPPKHELHEYPHQDLHEYRCPVCGDSSGICSMISTAKMFWEHDQGAGRLNDFPLRG